MDANAGGKPARGGMSPGFMLAIVLGGLVGVAGLAALAIAVLWYAWTALSPSPGMAGEIEGPVAVATQARAVPGPPTGGGPRIGPVTMSGPAGASVTLPADGPRIVHVWLQACADCMPAFEAVRALRRDEIAMPCPVVNVAYGSATAEWAAQYGVDESLVFDANGSAIVQPLGIGTFTTLVIDAGGVVRAMEYPQQAGYLERVRAAARAAGAEPTPVGRIPAEREEGR